MITESSRGTIAMVLAATIWGSFSLIFSQLHNVPPIDIVAHRVVWALSVMLIWLGFKGRLGEILTTLRNPQETLLLLISSVLVAMNWLGFVYAISIGKALEASLGYFLFPLVTVAIGAIFKREKLTGSQTISVMFATLAVLILTVGIGKAPWIAIFLSVTFSLYGLVKSKVASGAVLSVAVENVLLLPVAIIWLTNFAHLDVGFLVSTHDATWLIVVGALTGLALILFSHATKTISMFSIGMLFFVNPIMQACFAVAFLGSTLTKWHEIAIPLILVGCAIYCYDLWRKSQKRV